MILGDFILTLLAIVFPTVLVIRYRISKERHFLAYIFERGIGKYFAKFFAIVYVFYILIYWLRICINTLELNLDFLYYKLW